MPKFFLYLFMAVFGFSTAAAKKLDGYFIDRNGKKIEAVFNIPFGLLASTPNFERLQFKVRCTDIHNVRITLRPDEILEFGFVYRNETFRMLSRPDKLGLQTLFSSSKNIFLRLMLDGDLKLFHYYYKQYAGTTGGYYTAENFVLEKNNELMRPRALSFKKDMSAFLANCPDVAQRIEEKEFKRRDIEIIVMEYNRTCGK